MSLTSSHPHGEPGQSRALADVLAAEDLLADPSLDVAVASVHLERAWLAVYASSGPQPRVDRDDDDDAGDDAADDRSRVDEAERDAWVDGVLDERVEPHARGAVKASVAWVFGAEQDSPARETLLEQCRVLASMLEPPPKVPWRAVSIAGATLVAAVALAMIIAPLYSLRAGPMGPWRVEYYASQDFQGAPYVEHARKIDFDWGNDPPVAVGGFDKDKWSIVFRTCMTVTEPTTVRFRLSSDDGSRLNINGERFIDNWGVHANRTRTGRRKFEPGVYYLRLDYFEVSRAASLKLKVAFDDDTDYNDVPPTMLHRPLGFKGAPCG